MAEKGKEPVGSSADRHGRTESLDEFRTLSGIPVLPVYQPGDLGRRSSDVDVGEPGSFPFTRGIHRDMYRGRLWTMRQYAGYATAQESNRRYHYLL